jgi:hypothetical protein
MLIVIVLINQRGLGTGRTIHSLYYSASERERATAFFYGC